MIMLKKIKRYLFLLLILLGMIGISYIEVIGLQTGMTEITKHINH